jgi:mono/diheme cytochrome c family protein
MNALNKRVRLRWLVALACASAAAGAYADDPSVRSREPIVALSGAQLYAHVCQGCHMPQGRGAVGAGHYPKLAGDSALVSWQYAALTVLNGKNGMPAFGLPRAQAAEFGAAHLTDADIALVVNYVRSHFGNQWRNRVNAGQVAALPHPP